MDEILIEGNKYVSSKQATKLTGYAKDYIGQLCREGRVPARLVGRSWYVLETAIADHRFGKEKENKEKNVAKAIEISPTAPAKSAFSSAWETPRYETANAEIPPLVSPRIKEEEKDISERLQDSWREWFSRIGDSRPVVESEMETRESLKGQVNKGEDTEEDSGGVPVPIRAVHHHPLPAELPPRVLKEYRFEEQPAISGKGGEPEYREESTAEGRRVRTLQLVGAIVAVILASSAILGTGYFDSYLLTQGEIRGIAGLGLYNR